ncbi:MAG: cupin-like domain-containing protein [Xanthomonadales bacterium]
MKDLPPIAERGDIDRETLFATLSETTEPLVIRGLAADWALVDRARESAAAAREYLLAFYRGAPVTTFVSEAGTEGRIFYTEDLSQTNFTQSKLPLNEVLAQLAEQEGAAEPKTLYVGSTAVDPYLPGFREQNDLPNPPRGMTVRIWIGNRTTVAAHYDVLDNVACVCAGRRRFTLFPPDQLKNLYIGPIDFTPAGQQISLVDFAAPDFDRFPRFAEALEHAQSSVLEPGDAIFIPSMWWHHVQGLERFNILVNHWWREARSYMGPPGDVLLHALLNLRDLPAAQREAWRGLFDYYVFGPRDRATDHIPEHRRGALGDLDDETARRIRAMLRNNLNR